MANAQSLADIVIGNIVERTKQAENIQGLGHQGFPLKILPEVPQEAYKFQMPHGKTFDSKESYLEAMGRIRNEVTYNNAHIPSRFDGLVFTIDYKVDDAKFSHLEGHARVHIDPWEVTVELDKNAGMIIAHYVRPSVFTGGKGWSSDTDRGYTPATPLQHALGSAGKILEIGTPAQPEATSATSAQKHNRC